MMKVGLASYLVRVGPPSVKFADRFPLSPRIRRALEKLEPLKYREVNFIIVKVSAAAISAEIAQALGISQPSPQSAHHGRLIGVGVTLHPTTSRNDRFSCNLDTPTPRPSSCLSSRPSSPISPRY
jgi:hypothetical protein